MSDKKIKELTANESLILSRLNSYIREMDAKISMANVEIKEKRAAVGQLEKDKWDLEKELSNIEESIG